MIRYFRGLAITVAVLVLATVCPVFAQHQQTGDSSPGSPAQAQAELEWTTTGKVVEFMDVGQYTYLSVDNGTEKTWVAAPRTKVAVGDRVKVPTGTLMQDFRSKSLDRVFERIYFVAFIDVVGAPGHGASPPPAPDTAPFGAAAALDLSGIEKAKGGVTVARVFDDKQLLADKEVLIRGKVVKFSSGIMGRNWVHLQDGTTSAGSHSDLTVTTNANVKVGDTVLVRGVLTTARDFGHGYNYDVIVEDAEVTVE